MSDHDLVHIYLVCSEGRSICGSVALFASIAVVTPECVQSYHVRPPLG